MVERRSLQTGAGITLPRWSPSVRRCSARLPHGFCDHRSVETQKTPVKTGVFSIRCRRGDSNSHGFPRRILSALRLPFRHFGVCWISVPHPTNRVHGRDGERRQHGLGCLSCRYGAIGATVHRTHGVSVICSAGARFGRLMAGNAIPQQASGKTRGGRASVARQICQQYSRWSSSADIKGSSTGVRHRADDRGRCRGSRECLATMLLEPVAALRISARTQES